MKFVFGLVLFLSSSVTFALRDVNYTFDSTVLSNVKDSFHLLRTFVDYYYLLAKNNPDGIDVLKTNPQLGFCLGDPHPENFGIVLNDQNAAQFTINDYDDSGPCPLAIDFLRFLVSIDLYDPSIELNPLYASYLQGLLGPSQFEAPDYIKSLAIDSQNLGLEPQKKSVHKKRFTRDAGEEEVNEQERQFIDSTLAGFGNSIPRFKVLDYLKYVKASGGSHGKMRYRALLETEVGVREVELKEEGSPGTSPFYPSPAPTELTRIIGAFNLGLGSNRSKFYSSTASDDGRFFLVRPRFAGDKAIKLEKLSSAETTEVLKYEAFVLGQLHARSFSNAVDLNTYRSKLTFTNLLSDMTRFSEHFNRKYADLRQNMGVKTKRIK